jgi:plasmid replication initiation protein
MGVFEQRILLTCISRIDSTKSIDENRTFTVFVDDIVDLVDVRRDAAYQHLKDACERLAINRTTIELVDKTIKINWMSMVSYVEKKGMVELRFTQEIVPFLTQIKNNFTQYKLENVLKFKSSYSYRLYELINRWGGKEYVVPVLWLRERLLLTDKYERMVNFKVNVIDVAVNEINKHSNMSVSYEQIKRGREIVAFRFIYSRKQGNKASPVDIPDIEIQSIVKSLVSPPIDSKIVIDVPQLNAKEKVIAQNALAKVPEDTQQTILKLLKEAIAKGNVKSPIRYLNGLVSKALTGDLDVTTFTANTAPTNDFDKQTRRDDKIRNIFANNTEKMKADLDADGYVFIQGEGTISKSEFEALGLVEKAPHTISGGKSLSLSEMMDKALEQETESAVAKKTAKRAKPTQDVNDIPVGIMSEKEIAARQKILELEAQLIAEGKFEGVNKNAIADDEIAKLAAEKEATLKSFKKMAKGNKIK